MTAIKNVYFLKLVHPGSNDDPDSLAVFSSSSVEEIYNKLAGILTNIITNRPIELGQGGYKNYSADLNGSLEMLYDRIIEYKSKTQGQINERADQILHEITEELLQPPIDGITLSEINDFSYNLGSDYIDIEKLLLYQI